jgi:hypothetical protein
MLLVRVVDEYTAMEILEAANNEIIAGVTDGVATSRSAIDHHTFEV